MPTPALTSSLPVMEKSPADFETGGKYSLWIFNNDHTSRDEVIMILQKATGCSLEEAEAEVFDAEHKGKSCVHVDTFEACNKAANIIETIDVSTTIEAL